MRATVKGLILGMLGLIWLLAPVRDVYALDNEASCGIKGYMLCKDGTCASRNCTCGIKVLTPGDICTQQVGGKTSWYYCDGCSGKMIESIASQPRQVRPQPSGTLQRR